MPIIRYLSLLAYLSISVLPVLADNIEFEDAQVKTICVSQWDTDSDGELSYEEASLVTNLGKIFKGNKSINTFRELRFFTGLSSISEEAFMRSSLSAVSLPETVKEIGMYAFAETKLGGEVIIPGNVEVIRAFAFYNCTEVQRVYIEDGVREIHTEAFTGNIHYMSMPASVEYLAMEAVIPYLTQGLETRGFVFHLQVRSATPVNVDSYAFRRLFGDGVLIVPYGARATYESSGKWRNFYEILEAGDVNGDGALNVKDVVSLSAHIMGNRPSPFDERLADVNGDGKINVKDVTLMCNWIMQRNGNQN